MLEQSQDNLTKELEAFGLSPTEAQVVSTLLTSARALTGNEIASIFDFPRYQTYALLTKLEKQRIIKQVSSRPKKYIADVSTLSENLMVSEQRANAEFDALLVISTDQSGRTYQLLGFDEEQVRVHRYLVDNPSTRNDLVSSLSLTYEKVRAITDYLSLRNFVQKKMQGKALLYFGIPIDDLIKNQLDLSKTQLDDRRARLTRLSSILGHGKDSTSSEVAETIQIKNGYESIRKEISSLAQESRGVYSSVFTQITQDFRIWGPIISNELEQALAFVDNDVSVRILVDRSFPAIFKDLPPQLIERVLKQFPRVSIRVTDKWEIPLVIIDDIGYYEFNPSAQPLERATFVRGLEATLTKKAEFLTVWEHAVDLQPLVGDLLEKQKLIYFTGKNIEFEKLVTHNVALLGDKGVGKTSLVKRFLSSKFDPNIRYTLGILVDEAHIRLSHSGTRDGSQVRLIVHDFAGQPLFIDAYHGLLTDKSAIGLVFSLSDAKTLDNLDSWMGLFSKEEMLTKTFFLIGTKMDLPKKVDEDKIWDFRRKYKIEYYYSTSSLTGEGIQRLFEGFAENTALVPA